MKNEMKVSKTVELGPSEVAVVWDDKGNTCAYVADKENLKSMPPHVYQALAMMLSRDDGEIMSRMWGNLEKKMDEEIARHSAAASGGDD